MGASWRNLVRATMKTRAWVGRKPLKMKAVIGAAAAAAVLLLLWVFVNDHGFIFFSAELSHAVGISFLIYKLIKDRTCAGLSLKSQELTALFLVFKIYYSYMDFDIHTILDMATLITTLWVIYMIRVTLESSYMEDEDSFSIQYLVIACAFMAFLIHPSSSEALINSLILAFGCNLETIAIIPQLRLMQKTKIVESLTAHYVFSLGVARFLSCAHWILQVINTRGTILLALGYGFWPGMVILSEIVQTSILSDFCYYYIKRDHDGFNGFIFSSLRQLGGTRSMGLGPASSRLSISVSSFSRGLSLFSLLFLIVSLLARSAHGIYCDEDDCYELLGVSQSANASEIKKAYYKLSLKYHPDKNPDPESRKLFVKVANAYEILRDEATRLQYDYAVLHPEEVFYNTARYYHAYYGYKTDPRAVLVGLLLVVSALQYLNQWSRYNQALNMVKKTPAYKNRLKALELERNGLVTNKKKASRQMDKKVEEELSNELDLQIQGAEKPTMWNIFAIQFILLPYVVGKIFLWKFRWFWRYQIMKATLTWDDASYLTQARLKVPRDAWLNMDESAKKNLVMKRLWDKANMESYLTEMKRESKRRR